MRLYAITDRRLLPGVHERGRLSATERDELVRLTADWADSGVEYIQLREKDLDVADLTELATAMLAAMRHSSPGRQPRLLLNAGATGAAEVARTVGAAGVHLPGRWHAEEVGRARMAGLVSVGCHSVGEVAVARVACTDMALLSPIFPTESHPLARPLGLETLVEAVRTAGRVPVYALGGVNRENAKACMEVGAAGVAGIRSFLSGRWVPDEAQQAAQC
jgi:thiamine-phosphate pyrophosphorylase